ncbi:Hsp20 family protein [Candidatus Bathyarchaeota archaeon]|nr:Hsp20 family protein [Candidatus Bathyarchaeota archaeon]
MSAKWRGHRKPLRRVRGSGNFNSEHWKERSFRVKRRGIGNRISCYRRSLPDLCGRRKKCKKPESLIDIFEEHDRITVVAEFAGFKEESLEIQLKGQRLVLSAENLDERYFKTVSLPEEVVPRSLCTSCRNGVLKVQFEKALKERPRTR